MLSLASRKRSIRDRRAVAEDVRVCSNSSLFICVCVYLVVASVTVNKPDTTTTAGE